MNLPVLAPLVENKIGGEGADKILLIDISGIIRDKTKRNLLGTKIEEKLTSRIREELDKAESDNRVKAVVLRINTPGGDVTTTDIIYHEIKEFQRKKKVPVVAELMGVAASGGYYIAASADKIVAHPTTVTGAIGVVAYRINASGLMAKIGVTNETVKSGRLKDMGSPLRPVTDEEREVLQSVIDGLFERFKGVVMRSRDFKEGVTDEEKLESIFDGRVFSASQALELQLVDEIGYLDDAIEVAKLRAGIDDATLISYSRPGTYTPNIYSNSSSGAPVEFNIVNIDGLGIAETLGTKFMYLWMP